MAALAASPIAVPPAAASALAFNLRNARYAAAFSSAAAAAALLQRNARRLPRPPRAGLGFYVEPDIDEDEDLSSQKTPGEDEEDQFEWGVTDGAHTWHGNHEERSFWELVGDAIEQAGGPTRGPQKWISWIFLPVLFTAMAFQVPGQYLVVYTVIFMVVFISMEIAKPAKPHNFPPELYLEKLEEWKRNEAAQEAKLVAGPGLQNKLTKAH